MTVADVSARLLSLLDMAEHDPSALTHGFENIRLTVLEAIASGALNPQGLARIALLTTNSAN